MSWNECKLGYMPTKAQINMQAKCVLKNVLHNALFCHFILFYNVLCAEFGAQGEIRTHTPVKAGDFESCPCICNIGIFLCDNQTL